MLKALANPSGSILLAKGRADIGFKWNLCLAIVNMLLFWYFVRYGVFALAWSYVVASVVYTAGGLMILNHVIRLRLTEYVAVLVLPSAFSLVMGAAVYAATFILAGRAINSALSLAGLVAAGAGLYFALMALFDRRYLKEVASLLLTRGEGSV